MSSTSTPLPSDARSLRQPLSKPVLWIIGLVLAWFLVSEFGTEAWFRWKESRNPKSPDWEINWPEADSATQRGFLQFTTRDLTNVEKELLHYQSAKSATWRDGAGNIWTGFLLTWLPDKRLNQSDMSHNPARCLPAAGVRMVGELAPVRVSIKGKDMEFKAWEFDMQGHKAFAYVAVRRDRVFPEPAYTRNRLSRMKSEFDKALLGNRLNPLETLELIVIGPEDERQAGNLLHQQVEKLVDS